MTLSSILHNAFSSGSPYRMNSAPSATEEESYGGGAELVTRDGRSLPLLSAVLRADAGGGLARLVLEQTFENKHDETLHVVYKMPLPADGAVSGYEFTIGQRVVKGKVEPKQRVLAPPGEYAEPLPRGAPVGTHWLARLVGAYPCGEIVEFVAARQNRGEADNPAFARVRAPKQALHQRLVPDFALCRADHVAFVEDDQADIIDQ